MRLLLDPRPAPMTKSRLPMARASKQGSQWQECGNFPVDFRETARSEARRWHGSLIASTPFLEVS